MKYPAIVPVSHTGKEHITDEKGNPVSSLLDFWRWAHSDLMGNAERGILAEYLVACALDIPRNVRGLWDRYDLITPEGITIEVKSSGYLQSWGQEHLSTISFGIAPTLGWDDKTNTYETESKRQAQVYVFCVHHHQEQETANPLDTSQWTFYVLPTKTLDEKVGTQKHITLSSLRKLGAVPASFGELHRVIREIK